MGKISSFPTLYLALFLTGFSLFFFEKNVYVIVLFLLLCLRMLVVKSSQFFIVLAVVTLIFSGRFYFEKQAQNMREDFIQTHHELSAQKVKVIPDSIQVDGDLLSFTGVFQGKNVKAYYSLKSEKEQNFFQNVTKNMTLLVDGTLEKASVKRNLAGFDYDSFLKKKHIVGVCQVSKIVAIEEEKGFSIAGLRRKAMVHVTQSFVYPLNEYINGLLFGSLSKNFDETREMYQKLGIIHLFALSGMHVGFFLRGFRKFFLRLGVTIETTTILEVLFSLFYLGLTGFSLSVLRAVLQEDIQLVSKFFKIEWNEQQVFGAVVVISLFIEPNLFFTVSGQLSYFLGFVLLFAKKITHTIEQRYKREAIFGMVLSVSILPFLWLSFYEWNPLSILLTMGIGILFERVLLPLLVASFFLSFIFSMNFVNGGMQFFEKCLFFIEEKTHINWLIGKPSTLVFVLLCGCVCFFLSAMEARNKRQVLLSLLAIASLAIVTNVRPVGLVAMVDIGQGDSFFIQEPFSKKTTLIDTGGRRAFSVEEKWRERHTKSNAEKTLLPFLKARGVRKIDELILTHAHEDHYGDVLEVVHEVPIKKVFIPKNSWKRKGFNKVLQELFNQGVEIEEVQVGKTLDEETLLLSPKEVVDGGNNDSIVLLKKIADKRFLFTGDAEKEAEEKILQGFPKFYVDVLKVGHHGSKTSSSEKFLQQIQPKQALISCGVDNQFKHPNQETLENLKNVGSIVYETDKSGMIYYEWYPWSNQLSDVRTVK